MSLLFGFSVNDPSLLKCALYPYQRALIVPKEKTRAGWGLGFYQGDEILLKRRLHAAEESVDFFELARDLKTDVMVGHVSGETSGRPAENTAPFRFRQWMGAHCGRLERFGEIRAEMLASTPDFLRRSIRGQSDSEHFFYLVLAYLHDGGKLDDARVAPEAVAEAIRAAVQFVDRAVEAKGDHRGASTINLVLTNGRVLAGLRRGQPLCVVRRKGIVECPLCRETNVSLGRSGRSAGHDAVRSVLLVSDDPIAADLGGEEVPEGHLVLISRLLDVSLQPLG